MLFVLWQAVQLYVTVQKDKNESLVSAEQWVQEHESDLTVIDTHRFHGSQSYNVLTVEKKDGEKEYVFLNEDVEVHRISFNDIRDSEDVMALAEVERGLSEILRVSPAYRHTFLWEIVAYNTDGQLQYIYYTMQDGEYQNSYTLSN